MTEYLVVARRPKQFEYRGPFYDLDAAFARAAQLGRDDREVGDIQSDAAHLRFGKSCDSGMPDARPVPSPSDQEWNVIFHPEMVRFLRDGTCRRWEERGPNAPPVG